jgi:hypothetical protein
MGSGISLNRDQIVMLIERDCKIKIQEKHDLRPRYTADGYEIFYGFDDEEELDFILNEIKKYRLKNG